MRRNDAQRTANDGPRLATEGGDSPAAKPRYRIGGTDERGSPMETERIAKIKDTFLGVEDHGIFTAVLTLDYGGSVQGAGNRRLDRYDADSGETVGTADGLEEIMRIVEACGVVSWEKVKGRTVLALIDGGIVVGIKPLPTESGRAFRFADLRVRASR